MRSSLNSSRPITLVKLIPGSLILILILLLGLLVSCNAPEYREVVIETGLGSIYLEVYPEKAPVTSANFVRLVEQGAYTGSMFYRVVRPDNQPVNPVKIEVIQGGLLHDSLIHKYDPVIHEPTSQTGIRHTDGVISMARNQPGTASTEFFICIGDQPGLDEGGQRNRDGAGFAAFGSVTRGMEVVIRIQSMQDSAQYLIQPVVIRQIRLLN
jgi:peptidyl-prolyl cis-trans isomerase A (cyclophilin A)